MATFVLVHGGWAGSVVWRELSPRLRKAEHEVYDPTLTGIGERKHLLSCEIDLGTHIQDAIGVVEDEDLSDIVLVGHSSGSVMISGVADGVPENSCLAGLSRRLRAGGMLPPDRRPPTVPGEDWLVAPRTSASFGPKRPEAIALLEGNSAPQMGIFANILVAGNERPLRVEPSGRTRKASFDCRGPKANTINQFDHQKRALSRIYRGRSQLLPDGARQVAEVDNPSDTVLPVAHDAVDAYCWRTYLCRVLSTKGSSESSNLLFDRSDKDSAALSAR